jgi:ATP-dependent protease ClpP protease subunit
MENVINVKSTFDSQLQKEVIEQLDSFSEPCMICIDIESRGGTVEALENIVAKMESMKEDGFVFVTNVDNYAYSSAMMLFLTGDYRMTGDKPELLFHAPAVYNHDRITLDVAKKMVSVLEPANELMDAIIQKHTTITPELYSFIKNNTVIFNKTDLIDLGVLNAETFNL